jgi:tetratricopeptide (TPR) repeat protein
MSTQSDLRDMAIRAAKDSNWEDAVNYNSQIVDLNPEDTNAMNRLAIAHVQLKNIKKAKKIFKEVLEIDKNNKIAKKHLDKLQNNLSCIPPLFVKKHFIEEPGKTKVVPLYRLSGKNILDQLSVGKECELIIKNRYISVEIDGQYIGALPEDLSFRLTRLIKSGNEYLCLIRSCSNKDCEVYLREIKQSAKNKGTHSFPTSKISLNPLSEVEEKGVLEENIPVEIVETDTDEEHTFDEKVDPRELG